MANQDLVDFTENSVQLFNKYFILPVLSLNASVTNLDSNVTTFTNFSSVIANASSIAILNASTLANISSITIINASILANTSSIATLNTSLTNAIDAVNSTTLTIGGTNGTSTQSYAGSLTSGTLNIGNSQTNGILNIGTGSARSGAINVVTVTGSTCPINILNGGGSTTGGSVNIANGSLQTTTVNIASGTGTGTVTIGNLANTTIINSKNVEMGNNANTSTIIIGPLSQTASLNISTVVNGVRIDSHTTNENLLITQGNNKYKVTTDSYPTNVCNTALSNLAFSINTMTGDHCTAVGHNCLTRNSSGKYNIAIGADTLPNITTGGYNTALGGLALNSATTTSNNVAIGYNALASSVASAFPNVAVGHGSLQNLNNSGGGANVALGYQSLGSLTSGIGNVAIGYLADNSPTYGGVNISSNDNICIGNQANSNGKSNCVVIGRVATATGDNQIILGASSGSQTTYIQGSGGLNVTGATNIAIGVGSTSSINILNGGGATTGGSVNIANGTLQTTTVNIASGTGTGAVTIGNSANTVQVNGNLTLGIGRNITLQPTANYVAPTANTMLGGITEGTFTLPAFPCIATADVATITLIKATYILFFALQIDGNPSQCWIELKGTALPSLSSIPSSYRFGNSVLISGQNLEIAGSFPYSVTTAGTVVLRLILQGTVTNIPVYKYQAVRIA